MKKAIKKERIFRILSILGLGFILVSGVKYAFFAKDFAETKIEKPISVPAAFAGEFSKVTVKKRITAMPRATFMSPEGKRVNWRHFEGQYLLVNFWATWCPPCVVELPSLDKLRARYEGKGLQVIAISIDRMRSHEEIKTFLDYRAIGDFSAYHDDVSEVEKAVPMRGIPTTYLLAPDGHISAVFEGDANWHSPASIAFFDGLLGL